MSDVLAISNSIVRSYLPQTRYKAAYDRTFLGYRDLERPYYEQWQTYQS